MQKESIQDVFLQPGDYHFGHDQTKIRTILGSCVSIILYHPKLKIGGMCHYMLPHRGHMHLLDKKGSASTRFNLLNHKNIKELDGRYADEAMQYFLRDLQHTGTNLKDYQAYLLGGGNMFPQHKHTSVIDIGRRNIEMAHTLAEHYKLNVIAEHLGGYGHRQVSITLWDGVVLTKQFEQSTTTSPFLSK